jgi:phytoene dehydrogenase-like protein
MGTRESQRPDVVVVGAGLAGLRCARELVRAGPSVVLLEGAEQVGGRVRTDLVGGFRLDRGFQVLNDAYPELPRALDLAALRLRRLDSAVVVRRGGRLHRVGNPLARPAALPGLVGTDLLPAGQKLRLARYVGAVTVLPASRLLARPDVPAADAWAAAGITRDTVDAVLRPFFGGVVLEDGFTTSRRFLDLMTRLFARGRSTVPAAGMQAIPEQLAAGLPPGTLRCDTLVAEVGPTGVGLADGSTLDAGQVVVATDPWTAHRLVPALGTAPEARGVTTVYHSAPVWPEVAPGRPSTLVTDADGSPVANTIVLSAAAPDYAPAGRALVSTSLLHRPDGTGADPMADDDAALLRVLGELHQQDTSGWERLAAYDLPRALPAMPAPHDFRRPVRIPVPGGHVHVTGDSRDSSSLQGALVSGRRTARALLS